MIAPFLIVIGGEKQRAAAVAHISRTTGFREQITGESFTLLMRAQAHVIISSTTATVALIGRAFTSGTKGMPLSVARDLPRETSRSGELGALTRLCWGSYVAIGQSAPGEQVNILRSPSGTLSCYIARREDLTIAASSASLLAQAGCSTGFDWLGVARQLVWDQFEDATTCLEGVTELLPGQCLTIAASGVSTTTLWTPWACARREMQIEDRRACQENVRDAVLTAVRAWSASQDHILLRLSGGLDSSIVAASLSHANARFTCLTMATEEQVGDERTHARRVAEHLGAPLIECFEDPEGVCLDRSAAADLPRPVARAFAQSSQRIAQHVAAECAADAHMDGGGGDNVFCSLRSASPVADRLLSDGPGIALWRTAADIAALTETAPLTVLRKGVVRALANPAFRIFRSCKFLSPTACALARESPRHDWLEAPHRALPGKAVQIGWTVAYQSLLAQPGLAGPLPVLSPLMAQPVIEACLQVPSWYWCEGGRDRMVARRAFADMLPRATIERTGKGTPHAFLVQLFDERRREVRDLLLGGKLAAAGLLDLPALKAAIDLPGPTRGDDHLRIMRLVDIEAWVRHWA